MTYFDVWAYQIARGEIAVGDDIDLDKRRESRTTIHSPQEG